MIPAINLATILMMATATYATRIGGYLLLRNRTLGKRAQAMMQAAPGCVLIAVIAPHFVSPHPADLAALAVTLLAATRLPMLATVAIAVTAGGVFRHLFV
jgi:uncharacterized membrane protein